MHTWSILAIREEFAAALMIEFSQCGHTQAWVDSSVAKTVEAVFRLIVDHPGSLMIKQVINLQKPLSQHDITSCTLNTLLLE